MKRTLSILLLALGFFSGSQLFAAPYENVNKKGVLLDGYDVVSYFNSPKPQKGLAEFQVQQDGVGYWFSSEANKQAFLKDPKKYQPQFGGWCAYAVAEKKSKVEVDPNSFLIQDGRLLLFYDGLFGDTRKSWQTTKGKDAATYLKEADANWPSVMSKEP